MCGVGSLWIVSSRCCREHPGLWPGCGLHGGTSNTMAGLELGKLLPCQWGFVLPLLYLYICSFSEVIVGYRKEAPDLYWNKWFIHSRGTVGTRVGAQLCVGPLPLLWTDSFTGVKSHSMFFLRQVFISELFNYSFFSAVGSSLHLLLSRQSCLSLTT